MAFGVKIRRAQGGFRDTSPTISTAARHPDDSKGKRNSHLLALGFEIENLFPGIRGARQAVGFFEDRGIRWWKSARSGDDCLRNGPTRNMASSQIFCVNFWYPIKDDIGVLTSLLKSIVPSLEGVAEINSPNVKGRQELATFVEFEWVGSSETLEKKTYSRGSKATSIDAFAAGVSKGRKIGFFFEWKLVEEYREEYLGEGKSGATRRRTYEQYLKAPECVFSKAISLDVVLYEPFYQIFRMGLLGQKMIYEDKELDQVYVIPVYPRYNLAYSRGVTSPWLRAKYGGNATIADVASHFFSKPVIFRSVYVDDLWGVVKYSELLPKYKEWVVYMEDRYFGNGV